MSAASRSPARSPADILTGDELTRMQTNGVTTGAGASYGLGWRRTSLAGVGIDSAAELIWHGGAAPGYQADILLLPGSDRAVVLLQNSYGPFQEDALLATAFGLVHSWRTSNHWCPPPTGCTADWSPGWRCYCWVCWVLPDMRWSDGGGSGAVPCRSPHVASSPSCSAGCSVLPRLRHWSG